MIQALKNNYGHLFEDALLNEINQVGTFKEVPEGFKMMEIGEYIKAMPLLVSGAIKILREDNDGDELLLYFLEKGDTCAMTLTCCIAQTKSEIRAVSEIPTELIMIPIEKMEEWTAKYKSWRNFILDSYNSRLNEMVSAIDNIVFNSLEERLGKYLRDKAWITKSAILNITHQEIANDLHSSRVVISRLMKKLEKSGLIAQSRHRVDFLEFMDK